MSIDDLRGGFDDPTERERNKWIGVYVGVLAVALALCTMLGGNATKDATRSNIEAANTWAFFQAKNMRRTSYQLAADNIEAELAGNPALTDEKKKAMRAQLDKYKELIQRFTTDPKSKEGLDELFVKAKELEKIRDGALLRDPYFDWSQALLQIAIVLASVAIITGGSTVLWFSGLVGVVGMVMLANGYFLLVKIPFLG